jgi:hypothetical protein
MISGVIITAPDADWLAQFTTDLVTERLAACGQVIAPMRSIYRWQGEIYDVGEARVALHTQDFSGGKNCGEDQPGSSVRGTMRHCHHCIRQKSLIPAMGTRRNVGVAMSRRHSSNPLLHSEVAVWWTHRRERGPYGLAWRTRPLYLR